MQREKEGTSSPSFFSLCVLFYTYIVPALKRDDLAF